MKFAYDEGRSNFSRRLDLLRSIDTARGPRQFRFKPTSIGKTGKSQLVFWASLHFFDGAPLWLSAQKNARTVRPNHTIWYRGH
jgi:hypothetical protein